MKRSRKSVLVLVATVGCLGGGLVVLPGAAASALPLSARPLDHPADDHHDDLSVPVLDWRPCGSFAALCATAQVPLDYEEPDGPTISLAVAKLPAEDQEHKIGALFFDNGGPGGPNVPSVRDDPQPFTAELRARFDIIGLDPRGVGESSPIRCFGSAEEQGAFFASGGDGVPITAAEEKALDTFSREYGKRCAAKAGPLLRHVSTANVARDFDLIRRAVGDSKFSYIGFSYGTYLGAVYANLFPANVRGIVTDGNLDAVQWSTGDRESRRRPFTSRIQSGVGTQSTLNAFLDACDRVGDPVCPFAKDGKAAVKWTALLARVKANPLVLTLPDGQTFTITYGILLRIVLGSLYAPPNFWGEISGALEGIYELSAVPAMAGMATLQRLADQAVPFDDAFPAVICTDTDNPRSQQTWRRTADRDRQAIGPIAEPWVWDSLMCATWPVKDEAQYRGPWNRPTAAPVLLVNNLFDPATPYDTAASLSKELANTRLLTVTGYGHVAYGSSQCARDAVDRYLIAATLPADGSVCNQDPQPFDPPPGPPVVAAAAAPNAGMHSTLGA